MNTVVRILCRLHKFHHITDVLMDLYWLLVRQRIVFKVLILNYQAYCKTVLHLLRDLIVPYSKSRELRSHNKLLIKHCRYIIR